MKIVNVLKVTAFCLLGLNNVKGQVLPIWNAAQHQAKPKDWLINAPVTSAAVYQSADGRDIVLDNGLLKRTFRVSPNLACTGFENLSSGEQLLRAVSPEARITINGKVYAIGGLYGQSEKAYLKKEWISGLKANAADFQYKSNNVSPIVPYINWKPTRWAANRKQPSGKMLALHFESALPELKGVIVTINYELYDGIPLVCKWLSIENGGNHIIKLDKVVNEVFAAHEEEAAVTGNLEQFRTPHGLYVESNYEYNDSMTAKMSDQTTHWKPDSTYTSQVSYEFLTPCLLEVYLPIGPGVELAHGQVFKSIRTNELLLDSYDRERNGLAQRIMYSKVAPWTTENPIYMFANSSEPATLKRSIDQCAAAGFEMVVVGFLTEFMEDTTSANIQHWKEITDYAHIKGIAIGGYSLLSSRKISAEDDVIDPKTMQPDKAAKYNAAPCLGSKWGLAYFAKLKNFYIKTGFDEFDQDGTYVGDLCASTSHPGHKGLEDSQWTQMETQKEFYHWCVERGIFVNSPDWYFMDGVSKCALGYREVNFSLPRPQQVVLNRQNIYDGTWEKTPSMGWGFVPLTEYHGGGAAATIEPLSEHLGQYEQLMMQYFGSGIQACFLGTRLYDTNETKKRVTDVITWYKKYREILNSQDIHLRRPDGRDWDGIMHINPALATKGIIMLYNPTNESITRHIKLPLYYTGLISTARIREKESVAKTYTLNRDYTVDLKFTLPAEGYTWFAINK